MDYRTIVPHIGIKPYCVFCGKITEHVETYDYHDPLGSDYDRIRIRFPAHRRCFFIRKTARPCVLLLGAGITFIICLMAFKFFVSGASIFLLSTKVWIGSAILALFSGGIFFRVFHFKMTGHIHQYYVLNEILPESDKAWRSRTSRYKIN